MGSICVGMSSMRCSTFRRKTRNCYWQNNGPSRNAALLTFRTSSNDDPAVTTFREIEPLTVGEWESSLPFIRPVQVREPREASRARCRHCTSHMYGRHLPVARVRRRGYQHLWCTWKSHLDNGYRRGDDLSDCAGDRGAGRGHENEDVANEAQVLGYDTSRPTRLRAAATLLNATDPRWTIE